MKSVLIISLFVLIVNACELSNDSKNLLTEKETLLVSFVLLNHTKIISEIFKGEGEYLSSLFSELGIDNNQKNIQKMRNLVVTKKSTYDFAKAVVNEF